MSCRPLPFVAKTVLVLGTIVLILGTPANALQLDHESCLAYAIWTRDLIWAREMGADKNKIKRFLETEGVEYPFFTLLLRNLNGIWETPYEFRSIVAESVFRDCMGRRGEYGKET